ncbi:MAG: alkane 1-monooxygenase [Limimaricola sp.]|uniref:alkane 1-monooxygenase n=1 Tax=Limimaricola sp. TaxID=2211665 RepID=UPI001DCEA31C|nr:alkane 1-monooxygenase [Limimaricola sp.]MBI1417028.1 alkane 1-monooxygenase [Limimaricola sp.]
MTIAPDTARPVAARLGAALPFWLSLGLLPLVWIEASVGGWSLILLPLSTWYLFALIDAVVGLNTENADLSTPDDALFWYRLITLLWPGLQALVIFGTLWAATHDSSMALWEKWALFAGIGVITGTIGINYSHELMHQKPRWERLLGDLLLAMVMYSHFRSEHLRVHHRYVGTPRDPVTARYNEGFHRFFPRVLWQCLVSSFRAEAAMLARKGRPWWDAANPFWRYWALEAAFVALAALIGGWVGVWLFLTQAFIAIWQLELVNYVEHYGLTRKHLGGGKYEHVLPRHSWNAAHRVSNWLLINLQRHSDHHYKPDRRFPLLQNYADDDAPNLPFGYPVMTIAAMMPPLWRRIMNPRVRAWRRKFYPEITDWQPYKTASNPMPR